MWCREKPQGGFRSLEIALSQGTLKEMLQEKDWIRAVGLAGLHGLGQLGKAGSVQDAGEAGE